MWAAGLAFAMIFAPAAACAQTLLKTPEAAFSVTDETDAVTASAPSESKLYSKACVLMDGDSGRILYEKEGSLALANASTTKILTCIVVLENAKLSDIVTASKNAAAQPKVHLGMREGEQFYVEDLLYAMMLESYNDCAMALAEHTGGSMEGFAALMNEKAAEIGCTDTFFITPNGLDAEMDSEYHHTTAADLARLMKYCCWDSEKSSEFLAITQTLSHTFSNLEGRSYTVSNKNAFLSMMAEAISGKTGYTSKAGYCYVAAIESNGRKYTLALLACGWPNNKTYKWSDAKLLFQYGMDSFRLEETVFETEHPNVLVARAKPEHATLDDWGKPVYLSVKNQEADVSTVCLLSETEGFEYETILPEVLYRSVDKGDMVGKITCTLNGFPVSECGILATETYGLWDFPALFLCMVQEYLLH
jgi:D-alanyl-D-alanine carboxypeptidase (penicillin-binding protein 5/6)